MNGVISMGTNRKRDQYLSRKNTVEWVQSGSQYFSILEKLIDDARFEIHVQTYIFASDETGKAIADALIRAVQRNVKVYLLVDAYGSQQLSNEFILHLKTSGIQFRKFGELYSKGSFHIGRRLHHKVTVIDGHTSIVGGINVSNHYNNEPSQPPWLDFAVILRGNASRRLLYICRRRWSGWPFTLKSRREMMRMNNDHPDFPGKTIVRVRRNDFVKNRNEIAITYRTAFREAKQSILIVGGYFLPGGRTRRIIRKAIERGVKINIVVSEKSDVQMVTLARRYLYDWMMRNGIGVYEYRPANVHGKVIVVDDEWTSIGSYDLNNLSTFSNIELNLDIQDQEFSRSISARINSIIERDCKKVTVENPYRTTIKFSQFLMWLSYRVVKTLFILSVILAGKKEKEL